MQDGQQPGWVFKPGGDSDTSPVPAVSQQTQAPVNQQPAPEASAPAPMAEQSPTPPAYMPQEGLPGIQWTASEYIANPKGSGWYLALGGGSLLLAVAVYLLTKDKVSTGVIAILGIIVGVFAARQPQVLQYAIDSSGVRIGQKFYAYSNFKSFSIADDQAIAYIQLMPLRRFMPPLTIHYDPQDEDRIADTLAEYLPFEEHKRDMVDSITRRIRF